MDTSPLDQLRKKKSDHEYEMTCAIKAFVRLLSNIARRLAAPLRLAPVCPSWPVFLEIIFHPHPPLWPDPGPLGLGKVIYDYLGVKEDWLP